MSAPTRPMRVAIVTVSDRCSRGETTDASGPALEAVARERLGATIVATRCVPDEIERIASTLVELARTDAPDLILTTGGTGLAPRDVTPEAAISVFDRRADNLMDLARHRCLAKTPRAFLSRGVAGLIGRTVVLTLPGSPRGAVENLEALLDILPHAIETARGEVQDDGRPGASPTTGRVVTHRD